MPKALTLSKKIARLVVTLGLCRVLTSECTLFRRIRNRLNYIYDAPTREEPDPAICARQYVPVTTKDKTITNTQRNYSVLRSSRRPVCTAEDTCKGKCSGTCSLRTTSSTWPTPAATRRTLAHPSPPPSNCKACGRQTKPYA